jgi:Leucine-rich repeat (LRR) protein
VSYKFKPGTTHSTQRRFVGYIAQQIESVVPEAVQLIDGILHVDYESLIPYLSESIKQNFNDIKDLKSDTEKLESLLGKLYEQFTKADRHVPSNRPQKSQPSDSSPYLALLRTKWPWAMLLLLLVSITVALSVGVILAKRHNEPSTPQVPIRVTPEYVNDSHAGYALKRFYETTGGEYWTVKTKWMSNSSVCEWYGITCKGPFEDEHIVAINLPNNNITGGLNGQEIMFNLGTLEEVDLSRNGIQFGIAKLSPWIKKLNLAENFISDDIKKFNQLTSIRYLNLAHNRFYGEFQLSLQQLVHLKELNVSYTAIASVAPIEGDYSFDVCDWRGTILHCAIPEWVRKCGARCV